MRWLWVFLSLFFLAACSNDTPQDNVPPSNDGESLSDQDGNEENDGERGPKGDKGEPGPAGTCDDSCQSVSRSKDGSRLQVLNQDWIGEDGSVIEQPATAFDTKYGVHCMVGQWGNDDWRCYPEATTLNVYPYFSDSECKSSLIPKNTIDSIRCVEQEFFRHYTTKESTACGVGVNKTIYSHYHIPGGLSAIDWESPHTIYRKTDDGCEEYNYLDPSDYYIFTPMEEYHIPDEEFVKMER